MNCFGFKQFLRLKIIELLLDLFSYKLEEFSQGHQEKLKYEHNGE